MEDFDFYPTKPELIEEKPKGGLSLTIFSMVLFVLVFLLLLGDEVNFIISLLVVLIIHELGHFITMKLFKYKNVRMLFVPLMGAFVQGSKTRYSQKQSFIVTAAGPFPGVAIGTAVMYYAAEIQNEWLMNLGFLFLLLNIINLLPLDPLDGGQMFKLLFRKNNEFFLMIFALISSIFMIAVGWYLDSYVVMLFGFFMGFRVRALQKKHQVHKELKDDEVNFSTTYKLLSNRDYVKIKNVVLEHTPALRKFLDQVSTEESDPVMASQVNSMLEVPLKQDASIFFKIILVLLWMLSFAAPVILFFTLNLEWFFK
ncbi:MAG: metalloprotease family protein [Crocinitomicaceae bacterium]|jgi:stage IV sporulation protein FB|nr:metalloprotease family protein [Crocinitomicaceae bacterium]